jgi:hypothetical protein
MRMWAMGVFVAAVGRILLRDLTGVSPSRARWLRSGSEWC